MPHLQRAVATLRIHGDDLVPEEVTRLLGAAPSTAWAKGEEITRHGRTRMMRSGLWRLEATETAPENLDAQVAELFGQLTPDLAVWEALTRRFEIDLFCGWFMGGGNEGVEIAPATLRALGERGVILSIDLYGPSVDD